ncbi:hypothetical protein ILYODFUR_038468 [Ilyodon furcidens]|uniref:Uncharacterized protein n=1 Tax=Ilyodon furcidens TaxID=33524 RepID=A0ABV0TQC3_9TELE
MQRLEIYRTQDPNKLKYLDKWITTYNYDGRLNSQKLVNLQDAIIKSTKRDPRKMEKEGYEDVDYWLKLTKRREEGVKKRKEKEKQEENRRKQLMFHRAEDNETGCVGARWRPPGNAAVLPQEEQEQEAQIDEQPQAHATAVISSIYPGLPLQDPPPEYSTPPQTRSNKISQRWSRQYGRTFSPTLTHSPRVVPTAPKLSYDENQVSRNISHDTGGQSKRWK